MGAAGEGPRGTGGGAAGPAHQGDPGQTAKVLARQALRSPARGDEEEDRAHLAPDTASSEEGAGANRKWCRGTPWRDAISSSCRHSAKPK